MSSKLWLNQYPSEVPHSYEYPKQNVAQFLVDSASRYPEHIALDFMGKKMTFRSLLVSVNRFANALLRLGVRKGDRIAIMLPNCPQEVIAYYGALLAGGVVVMTNPLYVPREIQHQLSDADVRIIVTLDALVQRVEQAMTHRPLSKLIVTSVKDYLPFPKNILYPIAAKKEGTHVSVTYDDRIVSFTRLMKQSSSDPVKVDIDAEQDLALIQYTGGTTGFAKGVMLTHMNLVANTIQSQLWFYRARIGQEKYLAALPFFHVFGLTVLLNQAVYNAGTLILVPRFEINQVLKIIDRRKPTVFPGAPTMYIAVIHHPEVHKYDLSSINICISGAAPLPLEVQERFEEVTHGKLIEGYGLTEASPVTHANNIWEKRKNGSIGIPLPDTEARVVHPETGEELPLGEIGELVVRGPQVMKGYWNRPEDTERTLRDGWLYTGDLARMDDEGFFYILDRRKDLIIAGGYNIYPREIEEVLFEHPDVEEAVVAGVNDPYRGENVKAYIVLRKGSSVTEQELKQWCKERLAVYKVPKIYEFRESLPKTLVGKVLRRKLIEEENEKLVNQSKVDL
ncbi:long-chain fatty acid--CoA ligase [Paenibacillus cellulositrophicus]|uniref:long-chain-fatty-acid--CoA ligase n=1 Tax=Paenibacillus cellulositrophicus TaxID=562959 RepID=UPI00203C31DD|nr:long-chain fatty acid--CoA ligase [Paenibacillus cellulositrophicus]MCM2998432.1 long-chain fatty acid--CoA ligase [Paenibacillus cellulositrophicus]